jgi:hypothetical protein
LPETHSIDFTNLTPLEIREKIGWKKVKPAIIYKHDRSDYLVFRNWSVAEPEFRWSIGKQCNIEFIIDSPDDFQGILVLEGSSFGPQKIDFIINNKFIQTCEMDGSVQQIMIPFAKDLLKIGGNNLILQIPGACTPGNGDSRRIGFALRSIMFK